MKKERKKLKKRFIALIVAACILAALGFTLLGFFIGYWVSDANACVWSPSYQKLSKEELAERYYKLNPSEEDYKVLFEQTGLTEIGIRRAKLHLNGFDKVRKIQDCYFTKYGVVNEEFFPLVCTDRLGKLDEEGKLDGVTRAEMGFLERGDILVTSSTHFSGFRIGHSAIVTDSTGRIFQSNQVGVSSSYSTANAMFAERINFMVLRIKPEYFSESGEDDISYRSNLNRVTDYITNDLKDMPYSVFTGVFTKKDSMQASSCAHLIWYGFKHFDDENGGAFNLDLDSNGRLLIVPKDISRSPYVELVQTFGFDPQVMYP